MKTIICEDPWKSNFYKIDTGLGNRLTYWGLAYSLLLKLGRDWNIGIYKEQFPELDYIRLPKTFILDKEYTKTEYEPIGEEQLKNILDKNGRPSSEIIKLDVKYNVELLDIKYSISEHFCRITIKDKLFNQQLKEFGQKINSVHIRRGNGVYTTIEDIFSIPKKYQKYYSPDINPNFDMNKEKGVWEPCEHLSEGYIFHRDDKIFKNMDKYPKNTKFYISTDMPEEAVEYYKERFKNRVYFTSDFISKYKISPQKPDSGKYVKTIDELLSIFKKDSLDNRTLINLIDWFIIANSQSILYDGSSTWSYTASKVKGTKRISFKDEF